MLVYNIYDHYYIQEIKEYSYIIYIINDYFQGESRLLEMAFDISSIMVSLSYGASK